MPSTTQQQRLTPDWFRMHVPYWLPQLYKPFAHGLVHLTLSPETRLASAFCSLSTTTGPIARCHQHVFPGHTIGIVETGHTREAVNRRKTRQRPRIWARQGHRTRGLRCRCALAIATNQTARSTTRMTRTEHASGQGRVSMN